MDKIQLVRKAEPNNQHFFSGLLANRDIYNVIRQKQRKDFSRDGGKHCVGKEETIGMHSMLIATIREINDRLGRR